LKIILVPKNHFKSGKSSDHVKVNDNWQMQGIPFAVKRREPDADLQEAIIDSRKRRNLHGPFKTNETACKTNAETR